MLISGLLLTAAVWTQAAGTPRSVRPPAGVPRPAKPAEIDTGLQPEPDMAAEEDTSEPVVEPEPSGRPLVDVKPVKPQIGAAELLREAWMAPKSGGGLAGAPVGLATVLSRVNRPQQLEAIRLYWKLSKAICEHHYALQEYQMLATLVVPNEPPDADARKNRPLDQQPLANRLQIEQATSRARVREAELDALFAQSELAGLMGAQNETLPLPGDAPHVGQYRTAYDQVFGAGRGSPRLRFIAKALPIQKQVLETRAQAILSAEDSAFTATESFSRGEAKLSAVIARLAEVVRQRRAFLEAVQVYNGHIAEYAVAAAGEGGGVQELVAMMLKSPLPAGPQSPREARPDLRAPAGDADRAPSIDPNEPSPDSAATPRRRVVARPNARRRSLDPWEGVEPTQVGDVPLHIDAPLYAALASLSPVKRGHQLAVSLHLDQHMPADSGTPMELDELLRQAPAAQRRPLVAAYWRGREQIARHHVLTEQLNHLQSYTPVLLEKRKTEGGARAMVELRTAKLAAEAALLEGRLAMLQTQMELSRLAGGKPNAPWLLPTSRPHAGRYTVRDNAGTASAGERLAASAVGGRYDALLDRATAVVLADTARAQAATGYKLNEQLIDELLLAVEAQTQESFDFLAALTRYNVAILDYVDSAMGGGSPEQFVQALIVKR